ncbi:hypothetical protein QOZ80_3BG0260130 [Eleusine coracana subsp. coracana]|nr:hypothetical protein QOZ80_3BG0260130 [Eleusine coracana subsp. coracana]
MASESFSFPVMTAADIAEALHTYGIAPNANLRADDIAKPAPDLLPGVFSLFLVNIAGDDLDQQLGFEALGSLDNPELYLPGIQIIRLFQRSRHFLESIRQEKISLLQPIVDEFPDTNEHRAELKAKIAEHQKAIADHELKEQMEEPVVQQLQTEVDSLTQRVQEYNKQQVALRAKAKAIDEEKEEILSKISQADFELMKQRQENSKLLSKVVESPEKFQQALEEKKASRAQLKNQERIAMQKIEEKNNTLEVYTKAYEKLSKHLSEISALQEHAAAAKAADKEVKALKAKIAVQNLEIDTLAPKIVELQRKAFETEEHLKAKEKERDQKIADNARKMASLKSEMDRKHQSFEDRQRKVEETITKASDLCSQADSVEAAATKKKEEIYAKFGAVCNAANRLMDNVEQQGKDHFALIFNLSPVSLSLLSPEELGQRRRAQEPVALRATEKWSSPPSTSPRFHVHAHSLSRLAVASAPSPASPSFVAHHRLPTLVLLLAIVACSSLSTSGSAPPATEDTSKQHIFLQAWHGGAKSNDDDAQLRVQRDGPEAVATAPSVARAVTTTAAPRAMAAARGSRQVHFVTRSIGRSFI